MKKKKEKVDTKTTLFFIGVMAAILIVGLIGAVLELQGINDKMVTDEKLVGCIFNNSGYFAPILRKYNGSSQLFACAACYDRAREQRCFKYDWMHCENISGVCDYYIEVEGVV